MFFQEYNDRKIFNQNKDIYNYTDCKINPTLYHSFNLENKNAIILAAGLGMRMAPINSEISKGLIIVNNRTLVENIILKLKEKNINKIYIVVGYMKEQYEWLIDKYDVHLIINNKYKETNNCYSLYLAKDYLDNSYIIPCDIYLGENIFNEHECLSWYLFDETNEDVSNYRITKNGIIELTEKKELGKSSLGIAYINHEDSVKIKEILMHINEDLYQIKYYYWENILFENNINLHASYSNKCFEINTFEDLRNIDSNSPSLKSEIIDIIKKSLNIDITQIKNIIVSKKGMTNRSFLFETDKGKYIMRIPGEGTDQLINRYEEGVVYQVIHDYHIADEVIYFNKDNGYKLTEFIPNSRICDSSNDNDLMKCMSFLKNFHGLKLKVGHYFDIFDKIEFYEKLRKDSDSLYNDYRQTKGKVYELKKIIDKLPKHIVLTHIDAVPDNFLIYKDNDEEKIKLIDWEYASMQDSDVDIAMFCIYSMYNKEQCDHLIDIYYENQCSVTTRLKIYCYIAICGFLWSNWCEYKYSLGVEFGEYSLAQYRYAKDFYKYVKEYMEVNRTCLQ